MHQLSSKDSNIQCVIVSFHRADSSAVQWLDEIATTYISAFST